MTDHLADARQFSPEAAEGHVAAIVKYCGIALHNADSSLVSASDPAELARVRDGFAAKKLGLPADAAEQGIQRVVARMKDMRQKSRVTFYYLLAEATNTLDKLG